MWDLHGTYDGEGRTCYSFFINFCGAVAVLSFLLLTLTSLHWVRRHYYRFFYYCHVTFATVSLVALLMHWKRMVFYLCPSLLYYAASVTPAAVQALASRCRGGTTVVQATHLADSGGCVELCLAADPAAQRALSAAPLRHLRICVPELSLLWHPFTVCAMPGDDTTVRILFRQYGTFTRGLAARLQEVRRPVLLVDGYHGDTGRLEAAVQHDAILMVAGGIGIISYLSLVAQLHAQLGHARCRTRHVVLHWMCRDAGLVRHVAAGYLAPVLGGDAECGTGGRGCGVRLRVVVHHTGAPRGAPDGTALTAHGSSDALCPHVEHVGGGAPFVPASFSPGSRTTVLQNIPYFLVFATISWSGLRVTYQLTTFQSSENLWWNVLPLPAVLGVALAVSLPAVALAERWRVRCAGRASAYTKADTQMPREEAPPAASPLSAERGAGDAWIEHRTGRPHIGELLQGVPGDATHPAVYVCGPTVLHRAVREAVRDEKGGVGRTWAVYEEAFEV